MYIYRIYVDDEIVLLRARLVKALRQRHDVTFVIMISETIVVSQAIHFKIIFDSLFRFYE